MTEHEYNIEVLCTCYSLEDLIQQRKKLYAGIGGDGSDVLGGASVDELNEAISRYNEEQFKEIRDEMKDSMKKYGLI